MHGRTSRQWCKGHVGRGRWWQAQHTRHGGEGDGIAGWQGSRVIGLRPKERATGRWGGGGGSRGCQGDAAK